MELQTISAVLEALEDPTRASAQSALQGMLERTLQAAKARTSDSSPSPDALAGRGQASQGASGSPT